MELSIHNVRKVEQDHREYLSNPKYSKTRVKHVEITAEGGNKIRLTLFTELNTTLIEGELE